jgi:molybdopterin converting factor subunit 1
LIELRITVKFFASVRENLGIPSAEIEIPLGATVADCMHILKQNFPLLNSYHSSLSIAVNKEYAFLENKLKDGDEVGLIPPVSGG